MEQEEPEMILQIEWWETLTAPLLDRTDVDDGCDVSMCSVVDKSEILLLEVDS